MNLSTQPASTPQHQPHHQHQSIDLSEFEPKKPSNSSSSNSHWNDDERPISSANATTIITHHTIHQSPRTPFTPIKKQIIHLKSNQNTPIKSNQNTPIKLNQNTINQNTPIKSNNTPIKLNQNTPVKLNQNTPVKLNSNTPIKSNNTPIKSNNTPIRQSINPQLVLLQSNSIKPKARLTPEAIPRKKQLLPGAPNPIHLHLISNPTIFSSSLTHHQKSSRGLDSDEDLSEGLSEEEEEEEDLRFNPSSIDQTVLVSIRLRFIDHQSKPIWNINQSKAQIWESNALGPTEDSSFDAVLGPNCTNEDVYRSSGTKDLIYSSMMGYNSTIFAYGQTASGKTFTLTGDHSNPGLIPLSISDIFKFIRSHPNRDFLLRASYLEIYNEQINDLLIPKNQSKPIIKIRQDPKSKHFFPSPIREEVVTTESQVEDLLNRGNLSRHVSGTDFNHRSSRSHTILSIVIESRKVGKFDGIVRRSKVSLIDLAGSERATSDETRRTEGSFINKSLLTLEKVIGALSPDSPNSTHPTKSNSQHIPFRDSKLTQILQPALKGDSKVCVICTLNPTLNHGTGNGLEESRSTLRFARRVKRVRVQAEVNEILSEGALITRYRQQILDLQNQLHQAMQASTSVLSNPTTVIEPSSEEIIEEREEMLERLEKLQSIVLNASNLDEYKLKRRRESCLARPVSPIKGGCRMDEEEDELDEIEEETQTNERVKKLMIPKSKLGRLSSEDEAEELDWMELNELRLIISNSIDQTESNIKESYESKLRSLMKENLERKRFGEEMVKLLEASQLKAKKLELFIINELQNSLRRKEKKRSRRSSIGTYLSTSNSTDSKPFELYHHHQQQHQVKEEEEKEEEDRVLELMDLKNEVPEIRSLRASFDKIEIGTLDSI